MLEAFGSEAVLEIAEQDRLAREVIGSVLGENIMVLAGAGAGKTHEMIGRMVALVSTGVPVAQIAAITFTRKAAGEMQERFFQRLQEAATDAPPRTASALGAALRQIDQCFIGTIHSFCGRLLRERPLAAKLTPEFREVDAREADKLQDEAWRSYLRTAPAEQAERVARLGVSRYHLSSFFKRLCEFSDLPLHNPDAEEPDLQSPVSLALALLEEVGPQISAAPIKPEGFDDAQLAFRTAQLFADNVGLEAVEDQARFLLIMAGAVSGADGDAPKGKVTLARWPDGKYAKMLRDDLLPQFARGLRDPLAQWRAYVYAQLADFVRPAVGIFEADRLQQGVLTFNDLLLRTRDLLRDRPDVRRLFQDRFQYLFVDEFQDTDPVQAEILFYLSDTERVEEPDWTVLRPSPGRLFLVGDGKQSVYRFRRADFETFDFVRRRMEVSGQVVYLNRSFRAHGNLCGWVNQGFPDIFGKHPEGPYQAPFGPLLPSEAKEDVHDLSRVRKITTEGVPSNYAAPIAAQEARRIAGFIAAMVRNEDPPLRQRYVDAGLVPADPAYGDFMILTYYTGRLDVYADALEAAGIPFELTGAGKLGDSEDLRALLTVLDVVYDPNDSVTFVAYLRGPLAGLSDADFFAFHSAGGKFIATSDVPEALEAPLRARFEAACGLIRRAKSLFATLPPQAALEGLLQETGLLALSATGRGGSTRAGGLLKILAIADDVAAEASSDWTLLRERLHDLAARGDKTDGLSLETGSGAGSGRPSAVRLMNLHKAKGLEAPVVFLVDPYSPMSKLYKTTIHVSRFGGEPRVVLPVYGKGFEDRPAGLAFAPADWPEHEREEQQFEEAEHNRLLYVAATRAERMLVVSEYRDKKGEYKPLYWDALHDGLEHVEELEHHETAFPQVRHVSSTFGSGDYGLDASLAASSYQSHVATEHEGGAAIVVPKGTGRGVAYGRVMHRLMDAFIAGRIAEKDVPVLVRALLTEEGADLGYAEPALKSFSAFCGSALWAGIKAVRALPHSVLTEVPFGAGMDDGLIRGVIDLVYRTPDGWQIIDFKTDAASDEGAPARLRATYSPQLTTYATHWEAITGEKVASTGLWLLDRDEFVACFRS